MAVDILALSVDIGVPGATGILGYYFSRLKSRRQLKKDWSKERISEISEQREDMHTVLFLSDSVNKNTLEATIDYRFRKLFASVEKSPLPRKDLVIFQQETKKLFASNNFPRRGLSHLEKTNVSIKINDICVSLNSLLE